MSTHPLDGKDLRGVMLGYEHLSSFWKAELHWANALKFIETKQAEGADDETLLFAGFGPFFFMAEFSDTTNSLDDLEPVLLDRIAASAAEYRDFMSDKFVRDNLPWSSEEDLKAYLDMLSDWLRKNAPSAVDSAKFEAVFAMVWRSSKMAQELK